MIEYIDIHQAFDVPVLTGVSLTVATGETLSIVGPSGTGKSVLLKTTNGLLTPDRGDVRIDGVSVYHSERDQLNAIRRKVGYVFRDADIAPSMVVVGDRVALSQHEVTVDAFRGYWNAAGKARFGARLPTCRNRA